MWPLVRPSRAVDWVNAQLGVVASGLVLLACLVSAGSAFGSRLFSIGSNGWLDSQWWTFAGTVLLGAPYTLKMQAYVRVDLVSSLTSAPALKHVIHEQFRYEKLLP
jgi:TRAP-type mannitol/chloroaromatic compound transport system permease small subunit